MNDSVYEKKTMKPKAKSHIRKIAETHKGLSHSEEWKRNISENARHTDRSGQMLRAEKDGEVRWYRNGKEAARELKCSAPMVYLAASGKTRTGECRGWKVEWVDEQRAAVEMLRQLKAHVAEVAEKACL